MTKPIANYRDKWCPTCNRFRPLGEFEVTHGRAHRDCRKCEEQREKRTHRASPAARVALHQAAHPESFPGPGPMLATAEFPGLDMDRIYLTRPDLVRKRDE